MSVIGNFQGPYNAKGAASCLANIRRDVEKLRVIVGEIQSDPEDVRRMGVAWALDAMEADLRVLEGWLPKLLAGSPAGEGEEPRG